MRTLTAIDEISVPPPKADEVYSLNLLGRDVRFRGLKSLLGAADYTKAGDRQAGLVAPSEDVREAARTVLSELTLQHLYDRPLVDDQGRGVAPADAERVFDKFERLGAREPGTGLGLYISRRLARAMHGDITIESAAGEGARFVFTLPVA